tara:strand:- start:207 stop:599 length:393 start_codon:yes stop_codon:yes gene_type:complete
MATIGIQFDHALNVSVQPTDILYIALCNFLTNKQAGKNHISNYDTKPEAFGRITIVDHNARIIYVETGPEFPLSPHNQQITSGHYLFFSKDRRVNMSGILGYFAEVEYRNYTKKQAEIFATATNFAESSK